MFIGLLMLTASWGTTLNGWVICYGWSLFFYSVGVGGEYPMTATASMENATGAGLQLRKTACTVDGKSLRLSWCKAGVNAPIRSS